MYIYGELPSDLDEQDTTLGPPPPWFHASSQINPMSQAYWNYPEIAYPNIGYPNMAYPEAGFYGYGDREKEIEVNPVEELQELKYKQELNKKIPKVAYRYTNISPISPMFRDKKAKYGYGQIEKKTPLYWYLIGVSIFLVICWFIKQKYFL